MRSAWAAACGNPRAHWIGRRRTLIAALSGKIYVPSIFFTPSALALSRRLFYPFCKFPRNRPSLRPKANQASTIGCMLASPAKTPRLALRASRPAPRARAAMPPLPHLSTHTTTRHNLETITRTRVRAHVPPQSFHTFPRASAPSVCDLPPAPLRVRAPPARSWMQCRRCRSTS